MGQRQLTTEEREQIYLRKKQGEPLRSIAQDLNISDECARKWWRRSQKEGLAGLMLRKRGRPALRILSPFAPVIREASLELKRTHKRWGATQLLLELSATAGAAEHTLPSRSRLYHYFRQQCPDGLNLWTSTKKFRRLTE